MCTAREFARHRLLAGYAYSPSTFVRVQQLRSAARQRADAIWAHVDLLSTPTMPFSAPLVGAVGTSAYTRFTGPFNALGWPAVSVPVGLTPDGLPIGLQLIGRPWSETAVLRTAYSLEAKGPGLH